MTAAKTCTKCGEAKSLDAFGRNSSARDGLRSNCKMCQNATVGRYRDENRVQLRESNREYMAQRRAEDPEGMRQRKRAHDATYRARVKSNPELRALYFAHIKRGVDKRRALKHGAAHEPYSRTAIFAAYGNTCAYCDAPAEHLDHVIALSRGGADAAHNLLPACAPCNLSKGARSLAEWVQSWGRSPDPT